MTKNNKRRHLPPKPQALKVSRNISLADVLATGMYDGSDESRNIILYKLGVDVSKPIEEMLCTHRTLQNKVVECIMFLGFERLDREWIKSGWCSIEALYASTNDVEMMRDMVNMNKQGGSGMMSKMGDQGVDE